ncbi:MAG: glycosyltransferase family 2 protein [Acidimicrobiales bacterium]
MTTSTPTPPAASPQAPSPPDAPPPAVPSVAVIVPTFRRPGLLQRLLDSLLAGTRVPDEIVVVDNDPEGSVDPAGLPPAVRLLRGGFGLNVTAARNLGWRTCSADVCLFVDDDNEVEPEAVEVLAAACADPEVGLAGPVIYSGDEGVIWCGGLRFSRWTGITRCLLKGDRDVPASPRWPTDGLPDAYCLRREVLERVGGLDHSTFPMCGEELDLAERVSALGLEKVVVGGARIRHYGNVSEDPGAWLVSSVLQHGGHRAHLMARSRVWVHRRHGRGAARYSALVVFVPLWAAASAVACLRARAPLRVRLRAVRALWSGIVEGYRAPFPEPGSLEA